uniref:Uncharacterized protein n=1 Tax=Pipistrellus kuhlii TaxID=59472 RepID=A0A7J7UGG2_PIPKU|nr:hypothetical protein mPipKuh1_009115 [Pipistrellus kuhlii]
MSAVLQMGFWDSGRRVMGAKESPKSGRRETRRSRKIENVATFPSGCWGNCVFHPRGSGRKTGQDWEILALLTPVRGSHAWDLVQGYVTLEIKQSIALAYFHFPQSHTIAQHLQKPGSLEKAFRNRTFT